LTHIKDRKILFHAKRPPLAAFLHILVCLEKAAGSGPQPFLFACSLIVLFPEEEPEKARLFSVLFAESYYNKHMKMTQVPKVIGRVCLRT